MAYKTDGSSHSNGVVGEDSLLKFFNSPENFTYVNKLLRKWDPTKKLKNFNFISKGGTQNREDIYCVNNDTRISIKTKKKVNDKYKGTFDLINTSSLSKVISKNNVEFLRLIHEWEDWLSKIRNNKNLSKEYVKSTVEKFYNSILNTITGDDINSIFNIILSKEENVVEVIRDYRYSVFEEVKPADLHFLEYHWFKKELDNNIDLDQKITSEKNSSFIKDINGENSVFRIRIVLNNGIDALMRSLNLKPHLKNKNNTSSLTIKIQVDKVKEVIEKYDLNKNVN